MNYYNLTFFNQGIDFKYKKHKVLKETKNFVWLQSEQDIYIKKVSKKSKRVWFIDNLGMYETAKCNILESIK